MNSMRGGMPPREPRGMPPPLRGGNISPPEGTAAAPHPSAVAGASGDSQSLSYRSWGARWPGGAWWPQRPHGPDGRQRWRAGRLLLARTAGIAGKPLRRERPAPRRRLAVPQPVSVPAALLPTSPQLRLGLTPLWSLLPGDNSRPFSWSTKEGLVVRGAALG